MPYPNEHSARLQSPANFDKFRRTAGGKLFDKIDVPNTIGIIWGHLKDKPDTDWAAQALRFPTKNWTADEAKKWLKDNEVKYKSFEAASEGDSMYFDISKIESRCLPMSEVRINDDSEKAKITGYAAVFNTWADIGGWFKEKIRPGAFTKTIGENDIRALVNHDPNFVLGRNRKSKTLRLWEDSKGLGVEIDPPETTWVDDLAISMRRKDISEMSFHFSVNKQEFDYEKGERELIDVTLYDVSVVTFPAYPTTTAQIRSMFQKPENENIDEWKSFDEIMRKIKAGEQLTPEEQREMLSYLPNISVPPAKHTETPPEPPAKHSDLEINKGKDKTSQLLLRIDKLLSPSSI